LLLNRHVVLTIRNLTVEEQPLPSLMRVIRIKRIVPKGKTGSTPRSIRQFARNFFAIENHLEFAIEALLFGALLAISAWPIVAAASAITEFLGKAAS